jgi:hypothetical protein
MIIVDFMPLLKGWNMFAFVRPPAVTLSVCGLTRQWNMGGTNVLWTHCSLLFVLSLATNKSNYQQQIINKLVDFFIA